jgi:hypothetical protein
MIQNDSAPARERRLVRDRANQIERAISAVYLAVDALSGTDRLIALHQVLSAELQNQRRRPDAMRRVA